MRLTLILLVMAPTGVARATAEQDRKALIETVLAASGLDYFDYFADAVIDKTDKMLRDDPRMAKYEERAPGLRDVTKAALHDHFQQCAIQAKQRTANALKSRIAQTMSDDDLRQAATFYRSEAGRKFLVLNKTSMTLFMKPMSKDVVLEQLKERNGRIAPNADDWAAVTTYSTSDVGRKLDEITTSAFRNEQELSKPCWASEWRRALDSVVKPYVLRSNAGSATSISSQKAK